MKHDYETNFRQDEVLLLTSLCPTWPGWLQNDLAQQLSYNLECTYLAQIDVRLLWSIMKCVGDACANLLPNGGMGCLVDFQCTLVLPKR